MTAFARRGNVIAAFADAIDRDRFLDLSMGAKYSACEYQLPDDVRGVLERGAAWWPVDPITYLNGSAILETALA